MSTTPKNQLSSDPAQIKAAIAAGAAIGAALSGANATAEGHELLASALGKRLSVETIDGKLIVNIQRADGTTATPAAGPARTAALAALVSEARQQWPSLFQAPGSADNPSKPAASAAEVITRRVFDALNPYEQSARIYAGARVVD